MGSVDKDGYGIHHVRESIFSLPNAWRTSSGGRWVTAQAHRIAYLYAHGHLDADKVVRHFPVICRNCKCVKPEHLLIGTSEDNRRDVRIDRAWDKEQAARSEKTTKDVDMVELRVTVRRCYEAGDLTACRSIVAEVWPILAAELPFDENPTVADAIVDYLLARPAPNG